MSKVQHHLRTSNNRRIVKAVAMLRSQLAGSGVADNECAIGELRIASGLLTESTLALAETDSHVDDMCDDAIGPLVYRAGQATEGATDAIRWAMRRVLTCLDLVREIEAAAVASDPANANGGE